MIMDELLWNVQMRRIETYEFYTEPRLHATYYSGY
jgi:hypothetical protein